MARPEFRKYGGYDVVVNEGDSTRGVMNRLTADLDLEYVVLNEIGPGGGNPEVLVIGLPEALDAFERRYNGEVG